MSATATANAPAGLAAIEAEMARQRQDAIASWEATRTGAAKIADGLRETRRLLMLGMGASHAVGRAVEPLYRRHGIDAVAIPLSEQLSAPLAIDDKIVLITSQSGESAEVIRWLGENGTRERFFGLTLDGNSTLARNTVCLVGSGGAERAFAATRSLTITFALHLGILEALGEDPAPTLAALRRAEEPAIEAALAAFSAVETIVTSGRTLQGVAEALALGFAELARIPAFSLEGGQLRHGPLEMLGPTVGVLLLRCEEPGAALIASTAGAALAAGSPVIMIDASSGALVPGAVTLNMQPASGLAAIFAMLPVAQHLMVRFAAIRVADVGTPRRSSKITRTE